MADDEPTADALAATIETARDHVLARWRECVLANPEIPEAKRLAEPELMDHVPSLLTKIVAQLRAGVDQNPADAAFGSAWFRDEALAHGEHRASEGYGIEAAAHELATLRAVLHEVCEERGTPLSGRAGRAVHAILDRTIALGVAALARTLNAEIGRERDRATQANTDKDAFLSFVSHDMRNTLGAMKGWLQIMRDPRATPAMTARGHEVIARNVALMQRLLDDLMDLRRAQKRKLEVLREPLDLRALLAEAIDAVRPGARAAGITIEERLGDQPVAATGDPQRIAQVLANLIENSIKFTSSGGHVVVDLVHDDARGEAEIRVRDDGVGIPISVLPTIFEPFRQADPGASRRSGGLGLGLALVRELVLAHGGSVRAESAGVDRGATFVVRLPMATPDAVPEQEEQVQHGD